MYDQQQVRLFYLKTFKEQEIHRKWPWLWRKHFRIRSHGNQFTKLKRRMHFRKLHRMCIHHAPANLTEKLEKFTRGN